MDKAIYLYTLLYTLPQNAFDDIDIVDIDSQDKQYDSLSRIFFVYLSGGLVSSLSVTFPHWHMLTANLTSQLLIVVKVSVTQTFYHLHCQLKTGHSKIFQHYTK